jgi:hypothetical protein
MLNFKHNSPDDLEPEVEVKEELPFMKEEGDEIYFNLGDDKEAPETVPDKGETVEDKAPAAKAETEYEIPDTYKDKALPDVIKMHQELQSKIGKQGEELGKLRKQLEKADLSPEELREALRADEVKTLYDQEYDKLLDMDPDDVSPEELRAQKRLVKELDDEYRTKYSKEAIREVVQSSENKAFKAEQKSKLQETYDLSDDEVANVEQVSENNYLENGRLTERSYQHAMLDLYGAERMSKTAAMTAEAKVRSEIATAVAKQGIAVDPGGPSKTGNYESLTDLINNPARLEAKIDTLIEQGRTAELDALQAKIKLRMR